eukprot:scaffold1452_cov117-Isochrysis_galbana.AAC.15
MICLVAYAALSLSYIGVPDSPAPRKKLSTPSPGLSLTEPPVQRHVVPFRQVDGMLILVVIVATMARKRPFPSRSAFLQLAKECTALLLLLLLVVVVVGQVIVRNIFYPRDLVVHIITPERRRVPLPVTRLVDATVTFASIGSLAILAHAGCGVQCGRYRPSRRSLVALGCVAATRCLGVSAGPCRC